MSKRTVREIKICIHDTLSILSMMFAWLAMTGWFEKEVPGWQWKCAACVVYLIIWFYAQTTNKSTGRHPEG